MSMEVIGGRRSRNGCVREGEGEQGEERNRSMMKG